MAENITRLVLRVEDEQGDQEGLAELIDGLRQEFMIAALKQPTPCPGRQSPAVRFLRWSGGIAVGGLLPYADGTGHVIGFVEVAADDRVGRFQAGGDPLGVPIVEHGVDSRGQVGALPGGDDHEAVAQAEDRAVQRACTVRKLGHGC